MSNQLVLFGKEDDQPFLRWRRSGRSSEGEMMYYVEGAVQSNSEDLDAVRQQVSTAMANSGGLMIDLGKPGGNGITLKIREKKLKSAPQRALVVGVTGHHRWVDLADGKEHLVDHYETILVPAMRGLEKRLSAFVDSINDLPQDHRTSMLLTLVMPTYESRLAILELKKKTPRTQPAPGSLDSSRELTWVEILLGLVTFLMLGFVVWMYFESKFLDISDKVANARNDIREVMKQGQPASGTGRSDTPSTPKASKNVEKRKPIEDGGDKSSIHDLSIPEKGK